MNLAIEPEALHDLLGLVMEEPPTIEQCAARTIHERELAAKWAATTHLRASDNPVRISAKPAWLDGISDEVAHAIARLTVKLRGRLTNVADAEEHGVRWGWAPNSHTRLATLGLVEHDGDYAVITPKGQIVARLIAEGKC